MAPRLTSLFHSHLRTVYTRPNIYFYCRRLFHDGKADFVTVNADGSLITRNLDIFISDPHKAYIILDKDVGLAMTSAIAKQTGFSLATDPDKVPLTFYHSSRYFAHHTAPYPRIVIKQDLPHQNASNMSPATLWLWGASHWITLDGTSHHMFVESCSESHGRLKGVAELLKDR
ncbi:Uncharacterized protein TCAP_07593 [Tolypocladium capitatum]|uniref:Uncharacterized protein n=1 Tax=Tolypocladium capitatum TaxID=45235 RepID=A0A2K3PS86_9HYPO|nr:Uncharacterized protein TCAP_07593 [Tolypocladium capitatum]